MRKLRCFALALLLAAISAKSDMAPAAGTAGEFDYYVLTMSWSPTYCASDAGQDDTQQCGGTRQYAFVVHGLWPQYEDGWPDYCDSEEQYVPESIVRSAIDIMPSRRLVIHQWRKHGVCSGLSHEGYFDALRQAFEQIHIPARYLSPTRHINTTVQQLEADFLSTNAWLERSMMAVHCGNRRDSGNLRDVRICFTRDLEPRPCGSNESRQCHASELVMPPVR
jgi:ribonuclease T2